MSSQFDDMIEQYKKQMLDYYAAGKNNRVGLEVPTVPNESVLPQQESGAKVQTRPEAPVPAQQPVVFEQADEELLAKYNQENPKTGFIKLQVATGRQAIPIKNAKGTISKLIGNKQHVFAILITDEDGLTEPTPLPAPSKDLSEQPLDRKPYASYDVRVEYPGYITLENYNVPVFEGIVSIQPVDLIPQSQMNPPPNQVFENEPSDL